MVMGSNLNFFKISMGRVVLYIISKTLVLNLTRYNFNFVQTYFYMFQNGGHKYLNFEFLSVNVYFPVVSSFKFNFDLNTNLDRITFQTSPHKSNNL